MAPFQSQRTDITTIETGQGGRAAPDTLMVYFGVLWCTMVAAGVVFWDHLVYLLLSKMLGVWDVGLPDISRNIGNILVEILVIIESKYWSYFNRNIDHN